jgi:hypothetical protein
MGLNLKGESRCIASDDIAITIEYLTTRRLYWQKRNPIFF